jgi:hypothetical protein
MAQLCMACLFCGEPVGLDEMEKARLDHGMYIHPKVCDKCKEAVLYIRNQLQKEGAIENAKSVQNEKLSFH